MAGATQPTIADVCFAPVLEGSERVCWVYVCMHVLGYIDVYVCMDGKGCVCVCMGKGVHVEVLVQ